VQLDVDASIKSNYRPISIRKSLMVRIVATDEFSSRMAEGVEQTSSISWPINNHVSRMENERAGYNE
jgi:hypothetical protein